MLPRCFRTSILSLSTSLLVVGSLPFAHASPDEFLLKELTARDRAAMAELVEQLDDSDPYRRNYALRRLAAVGRPAIPALREMIQSSNPKRVSMCALTLGAIGDEAAFAIIHDRLQRGDNNEDKLRGMLLALARCKTAMPLASSKEIRELVQGREPFTVTRVASLVSAALPLPSLVETIKPALNEKQPFVRASYFISLGEGGDAEALSIFKDELRRSRNRVTRSAALYGLARLSYRLPDVASAAQLTVLPSLFKRKWDDSELAMYCVALGAFPSTETVKELQALLKRHGADAMPAVFSLAQFGIEEADAVLEEALKGTYSKEVESAACLAITEITSRQRFLPLLRKKLTSQDPSIRNAALLALARIGDRETAEQLMDRLPQLIDPTSLYWALVITASELDVDVCADLSGSQRSGAVGSLCAAIGDVRSGRKDPRLLHEGAIRALTRARGHWLLRMDDFRNRLIAECLELDRIEFYDDEDGAETLADLGELAEAPDLSAPGDEVEGGGDEGSGGEGSGEGENEGGGNEGGGEGSGEGSEDNAPPTTGFPNTGEGRPTLQGFGSRKRGKNDFTRFEADLLLWLNDFPLFEHARPYDL